MNAKVFCDKITNHRRPDRNGEQEERRIQTRSHDRGKAEHHPGTAAGV